MSTRTPESIAREEWRRCSDFPHYEVSSLGRVRNIKTLYVLKPRFIGSGYVQVQTRNEKTKQTRVHRLVLTAFSGPCPVGCEAAHLDGDKNNNIPSNLAWKTRVENGLDRITHGTWPSGENNPISRLTEQDVVFIRTNFVRRAPGITPNRKWLAKLFGITASGINQVARGTSWRHITPRCAKYYED